MQTVPGISLTSTRMVSTRPLCQGAHRNTDKNTQHICRLSQQRQIRRARGFRQRQSFHSRRKKSVQRFRQEWSLSKLRQQTMRNQQWQIRQEWSLSKLRQQTMRNQQWQIRQEWSLSKLRQQILQNQQILRNQQWQIRWRQTTDTFSRQIQLRKKLLQDLNRQQPMDSCLRKNWKNFWIISRTMPKMKNFLRHLPKMNAQQILCQPFRTG